MILRLLRKLLSADALGLLLIFLALETLNFGIAASLRGTDTRHLIWVCLMAAGIGIEMSRRDFNTIRASILMIAVGMLGIWVVGARLLSPLLDVIRTLIVLIPQILPAIREKVAIDTTAVAAAWSLVVQASDVMALRWEAWLVGVQSKALVADPLIRSMLWTLLLWLIAAWTGWFAQRRNAILALLPSLVLLSAIISYSEHKVETLWLLVFLLLLLMGVWNYKNHTIQWERRKVDYSESICYDNTQAVLFLAIAIGIVAYITPSISWREIRQHLQTKNNSNQTANILGIQQKQVPIKEIPLQKPSLPREHLLTEGFEQSQQIVMRVRTGELPPIPSSSLVMEVPRYYWRSTIYDQYVGAGWVTSAAPPQNYKANTPLVQGLLQGYRPLHLEVEVTQPEGKLIWTGILYSADVPVRADWRVRPASDLFADQTELLQADLFIAATSATEYRAESFVPTVSIQELRSASTEYPEEIHDNYLGLPQEVPQRVYDLAGEIVQGLNNPYDKAKAIEHYLRANYPYDLDVPAPPTDQDVADYFLFDLRKGYCDYYATAMVVLARASGLPARFVSGYASGEYDAPNAQYVVRALHAHSWPEIYFPEIGWVEFEPTGSQPEIERPEKASEILRPAKPVTPTARFLFQLTSERMLSLLTPFAIALLLVVLYFALFERIFFLSLAPPVAIERLYRSMYRLGRPLAGQPSRAETAYEFAEKLIDRIQTLQAESRNKSASQQTQHDIQALTNIYYSSLFSAQAAQKNDVRLAFHLWQQLRWFLLRMKLKHWLWEKNKIARPSFAAYLGKMRTIFRLS